MKNKKFDSLLFRFAVIFAVFTVVTLVICGFMTYVNQTNIYNADKEKSIQEVAGYLASAIQADGADFIWFQDFFLKHKDEMLEPIAFEDSDDARAEFERLFAEQYPGKILGQNITFDELSPEVQLAYAVYNHEYYLRCFEKASKQFGLAYAYYVVPTGGLNMCYVLDAVREEKVVDGKTYLSLGIEAEEPLEDHQKMWEAWNTGKSPSGYDTYNNKYGKTYAYYMPLYVEGQKLGVIGTEIEIAAVNREILQNTFYQLLSIALVLIICVSIVLYVINRFYISKIKNFSESVRQYSLDKDPGIAGTIERDATGRDELSALGSQTAAMILELENYMKSLVATTRELTETKQHADAMQEMAIKDALTGIRNKTAYDAEVKRLEWQLEKGDTAFGLAMADLNFLKRINDNYGHEQGNIALKKCCNLICAVFTHSPVFRIGGDEFVIILEGHDYEQADELVSIFNAELGRIAKEPNLPYWERISVALGYAKYDKRRDGSVSNVFKRADKAMYERKKEMKAVRK